MIASNQPTRLAVFGTFDIPNYGDLLFPAIIESALRKRRIDAELSLFSPTTVNPPGSWFDGVHEVREAPRLFPDGPDAVIVGGGDVIRTDPMVEVYPAHTSPFTPGVSYWAMPTLLGAAWRVPVIWNALGVLDNISGPDTELVRAVARHVDCLTVRDSASRTALDSYGIGNATVVPDCGVLVDSLFDADELAATWSRLTDGRPNADGVTLCFQASPGFIGEQLPEVAQQLSALLENNVVSRVVLLPICHLWGDAMLVTQLAERLGEAALPISHEALPTEIAAAIAASDLFIGTSLHGCITALAYGKPFATANTLNMRKHCGFFELAERADFCMRDWSSLSDTTRAMLNEDAGARDAVRATIRARAEAHFDRLADILRAPRVTNGDPPAQISWRDDELTIAGFERELSLAERSAARSYKASACDQFQHCRWMQQTIGRIAASWSSDPDWNALPANKRSQLQEHLETMILLSGGRQ